MGGLLSWSCIESFRVDVKGFCWECSDDVVVLSVLFSSWSILVFLSVVS